MKLILKSLENVFFSVFVWIKLIWSTWSWLQYFSNFMQHNSNFLLPLCYSKACLVNFADCNKFSDKLDIFNLLSSVHPALKIRFLLSVKLYLHHWAATHLSFIFLTQKPHKKKIIIMKKSITIYVFVKPFQTFPNDISTYS